MRVGKKSVECYCTQVDEHELMIDPGCFEHVCPSSFASQFSVRSFSNTTFDNHRYYKMHTRQRSRSQYSDSFSDELLDDQRALLSQGKSTHAIACFPHTWRKKSRTRGGRATVEGHTSHLRAQRILIRNESTPSSWRTWRTRRSRWI